MFVREINFTVMINLRVDGNSYASLMGAWQPLIKFKMLRFHDPAIPLLGVGQQGPEYKNVQSQYF